MTYSPTQEDIDWARFNVSLLAQNGTMVFPSSELVYKVDHTNYRLTLMNPERLEQYQELHERTKIVFAEIGYTVDIDVERLQKIA